ILGSQSLAVFGQHHHHPDTTAETQQHVTDTAHQKSMDTPHSKQHGPQHMSHAFSRSLPMNRNGSGTGWLPDNSPMYGYMAHSRQWMYMFHGNLFLRYNNQDIAN